MTNNSEISPSNFKRAKSVPPPSSPARTMVPTRPLFRCKCPKTISPPDINRYQSCFQDNSISIDRKVPSKRLSFDSSRSMMDKPCNLKKSDRFFVNPSTSYSLIQEAHLNLSASTFKAGNNIMKCIYSSKPQDDFYKSMWEVVGSRVLEHNLTVDYDYMEELLTFYLEDNEESLHEHIYNAYLRVMVVLDETFGKRPIDYSNKFK